MHTLSSAVFSQLSLKLILALGVLLLPFAGQAFYDSGPIDLDGYAWSSNIGWISFNCETGGDSGGDVCGDTDDYKVTINTDGTVTGYAWSSNIGWIRFGGLGSFPAGGGTVASNAYLVDIGSGVYELRGWARACAGTQSGDCSTMTSRTDGWDGWIALSGNNHQIQFDESGPLADSFAWGSSVVGWVDMSVHLTFGAIPSASITFPEPHCQVALGATDCDGLLNFQFTNVDGTDNPQVNRVAPSSEAVASGALSGTNISTPMRVGSNTYRASISANPNLTTESITIECIDNASPTGAGGVCECDTGYYPDAATSTTCEAVPAIDPVMEFEVNQDLIRQGDRVTFTINVAGPNPECTVAGPGVTPADNPIISASGPIIDPIEVTYESVPLRNLGLFSLTCTGVGPTDPRTERTSVRVIPVFREQ